jgi:hypothetical protein
MSQVCKRCGEWEEQCTCNSAGAVETNPLEGFGIISQQQWEKLTAENELRTKERDQAIELLEKIQEEHGILIGFWLHRNPDKFPDLSAHINKIALEDN